MLAPDYPTPEELDALPDGVRRLIWEQQEALEVAAFELNEALTGPVARGDVRPCPAHREGKLGQQYFAARGDGSEVLHI